MLIPDEVQGHLLKVLFCTRHLFKRAEAILIAPSMVVPRGVFKINPQCMMHIDCPMMAPFMIISHPKYIATHLSVEMILRLSRLVSVYRTRS